MHEELWQYYLGVRYFGCPDRLQSASTCMHKSAGQARETRLDIVQFRPSLRYSTFLVALCRAG